MVPGSTPASRPWRSVPPEAERRRGGAGRPPPAPVLPGAAAPPPAPLPGPAAPAQGVAPAPSAKPPVPATRPARGAPAAPAPEGRLDALTLADAVRMGLEHNLELAAGAYDPAIAVAGIDVAEGAFDTLLTARFAGGRRSVLGNDTFGGPDVEHDDVLEGEVGASRKLRRGGSLAVVFRADRLDSNSTLLAANPRWASGVSVEYVQPLLRGAGDVATADVRRARNDARAAEQQLAALTDDVVLRIHVAYWNLEFLQAQVRARTKSEDVARNLLEQVQLRFDARAATVLDLAEAKAGLEGRRGDRITAEGLEGQAQDALRALILPFDRAAPLDLRIVAIDDPRVLTPADAVDPSAEARYVAQAVRVRPELLAAQAALDDRAIDVEVARSELRPQLDLVARVGSDGLDGPFGNSWSEVVSGQAPTGTLGLNLSVFLGRRTAHANLRIAQWSQSRAAISLRERENRVVQEVRFALRELTTARARGAAAAEEIRSAREALEGEQARERSGESTPFDVLQKEEVVTQAVTERGPRRHRGPHRHRPPLALRRGISARSALKSLVPGLLWATGRRPTTKGRPRSNAGDVRDTASPLLRPRLRPLLLRVLPNGWSEGLASPSPAQRVRASLDRSHPTPSGAMARARASGSEEGVALQPRGRAPFRAVSPPEKSCRGAAPRHDRDARDPASAADDSQPVQDSAGVTRRSNRTQGVGGRRRRRHRRGRRRSPRGCPWSGCVRGGGGRRGSRGGRGSRTCAWRGRRRARRGSRRSRSRYSTRTALRSAAVGGGPTRPSRSARAPSAKIQGSQSAARPIITPSHAGLADHVDHVLRPDDVAVADDRDPDGLLDGADRLAAGPPRVLLLAGAAVDGHRGRALGLERARDVDALRGVVPAGADLHGDRHGHAAADAGDDRPAARRLLQQRGARAPVDDLADRAAHVDVDGVGAEVDQDLGRRVP